MNVAGRFVVLGAIVVAGACNSSPTEYLADGLRATVSPPQLTLTNTSDERIVYRVVEQEFAARALFVCLSTDSSFLTPSGEVTLQYSSIPGYEQGKSKVAIVSFATVTDADSGCINEARLKGLRVNL